MDDFDSFYNGHLESNLSKNKKELNKCFEGYFIQFKYNNIVHMSPIDRLIAKNQQKLKIISSSVTSSSVKKPYLTKKKKINEQNKLMNKDTSVSTMIRPRKRRINWSETFKERRRSRRLSHLPPIDEDMKKEIKNEEFSESFDDISYSIKIEKDIKTEIKDNIDDGLQKEDSSNLVLNTSSDPNVLSNNYIHQQVEFSQENNSIFGNTMNDILNPSTDSENNFATLSYTYDSKTPSWDTCIKTANVEPSNLNLIAQELIQDDFSICSDELSQEDNSNFDFNTLSNNHTPPQVELTQDNSAIFESTMNSLLNYSTYSENNFLLSGCNKTNNINFHLEPALTSPKTAYKQQTSMHLVNDPELTLKTAGNDRTNLVVKQVLSKETVDNKQTNSVVKQELSQEIVDYEDTNVYNYNPYNNTNMYDTEIHESENHEMIEFWSFKSNEKHMYAEIEENISSGTTNVHNNDLNKIQYQSPYTNNSEKPTIIENSSIFAAQNKLESSIMDRSVTPKTNSRNNQNVISQLPLLNNSEITSPKANSLDLPLTYFDETNNKLTDYKPILPVTQSHSEINLTPKANSLDLPSTYFDETNNKLTDYKPILPVTQSHSEINLTPKANSLDLPSTYFDETNNKLTDYKPILLVTQSHSEINLTPKANSLDLPSTYFDETNNKLTDYKPILAVTQSHSEINLTPKANSLDLPSTYFDETNNKLTDYKPILLVTQSHSEISLIPKTNSLDLPSIYFDETYNKLTDYKPILPVTQSHSEINLTPKANSLDLPSTYFDETNNKLTDYKPILPVTQPHSEINLIPKANSLDLPSTYFDETNNKLTDYKPILAVTQSHSEINLTPKANSLDLPSTYFDETNNKLTDYKPILPVTQPHSEINLIPKANSLDLPSTYFDETNNKLTDYKPILAVTQSHSEINLTPKANSLDLPSTYFDETNNKLTDYKPILPVTLSHSEINYPKLENKKEEEKKEEIPILQENYYELSIDEKIIYQKKLTFVTALELASIKELKNIKIIKGEKDVITHGFQELPIDNGNYTDQKIVPTSSEKKKQSFVLEHSNDRNKTRHTAVPILIPERSSGSSFHPGHVCAQNCRACYVTLGTMDTACHIAQVKNPDKQKLCLENVSHLIGPNSCLCPTCFRIVLRKSSIAYMSKNICMFMSCKLPASKHYKSEWVKNIKCMLIKKGTKIRSWANNTSSLPTCDSHHDEILRVIQCQLCGNRTPHKKILEISEIEDFNKSVIQDKIPITLDADFFICKSCHIYLLWKNNKLLDSMNKPKDIRAHCSTVIKRICERHKINIPLPVNKIPDNHIIYKDKSIFKRQLKRKTVKPITKNKVPENNIKPIDENVFEIPAKVISSKPDTVNKTPVSNIKNNNENVFKIHLKETQILPNLVNKVPVNNIRAIDENVLKIPAKVTSTKPDIVNEIPENSIKDTNKNIFKIHSKETSITPNTKDKVLENNIKATDENIKKSAKLKSTKHNTLNKIPENNITNSAQKTLKTYSRVTPVTSKTLNKVYVNNFKDAKTISFKTPVKVKSPESSIAYKIPTIDSFKTSTNNKNDQLMVSFKPPVDKNIVDIKNINCQTINLSSVLQLERPLPSVFIENQPITTQNNLKQILDPPSTNKIPLQKVQHIKFAMKPGTTKLLSCNPSKSMPKQKMGPVVSTSILPLADPMSLPNLPEFQFNDTIKLNVLSDVSKLYKQLQKPFSSSTELFNFLLLLENFRLQGELVQNKKYGLSCSLKQNSIMNQDITKDIFPQFKRKCNSENHCEQLEVTPLHTNEITPINSIDDSRITKNTNMNNYQIVNTNAQVPMKQNLSTPSIPVTIKNKPLNKFISIPKSVVAKSIICKPSEIYNSKPNNNQIIIPPMNTMSTTLGSFNSPTVVISENSTVAAKCIRFVNIKNIAMKRVYPIHLNYSPVNLNKTRHYRQILPSTVDVKQISPLSMKEVKNLRVNCTTKRLSPEELSQTKVQPKWKNPISDELQESS